MGHHFESWLTCCPGRGKTWQKKIKLPRSPDLCMTNIKKKNYKWTWSCIFTKWKRAGLKCSKRCSLKQIICRGTHGFLKCYNKDALEKAKKKKFPCLKFNAEMLLISVLHKLIRFRCCSYPFKRQSLVLKPLTPV